ncbi:MAG: hypothetical protein ABGY24_06780, partial [bacterium]
MALVWDVVWDVVLNVAWDGMADRQRAIGTSGWRWSRIAYRVQVTRCGTPGIADRCQRKNERNVQLVVSPQGIHFHDVHWG